MNKVRGHLIVFEGVDASGKTTLCDGLYEELLGFGLPVKRYDFPGSHHGTLGELVYRIHHLHAKEFSIQNIDPCALQLLHIAAHIDMIGKSIIEAINNNETVILDRFWWSTFVYGLCDGVSEESLQLMIELEKQAWGSVKPDLVFLVDTPTPLRIDEVSCCTWQRKRLLYQELLKREARTTHCVTIQTAIGSEAQSKAMLAIMDKVGSIIKQPENCVVEIISNG